MKQRVLRTLYLNGPLTAAAISTLCGVSSGSCLSTARRLCRLGLAEESVSEAKNGRKQVRFSPVAPSLRCLGIHILPDFVVMSLVSPDGTVEKTKRFERDVDYSESSNVNELTDCVEKIISSDGYRVCSIGISCPGPIRLQDGLLRRVVSVGGINISLFADELREAFELPVCCAFDSECAGEYFLSVDGNACRGVTCCVCAGDTVTASFFVDGVCLSSRGLSGLIGHTSINFRDERCYCGNRGCLEQYASTSLLADTLHTNTLFGVNLRTFDETVELYKSGDPATVKCVDNLAGNLAIGLVNMIWTLNPSSIFVTGELTRFGGVLSGPIHSVIKQRVLPEAFSDLTVKVSDNSTDDFAAGAALMSFGVALESNFKKKG